MSKKPTKITANKKKNKVSKRTFIMPKVYVSLSVMETIRSESILYGQFETGGLLLGEKIKINDEYMIFIKKATGPGNNSEHGTHFFKPNIDYYKEEMMKELYRNSLVYVGEWHKHPGMFDEPSCTDLETMKEITNDNNSKDVLAIIATTPSKNEQNDIGEIVQTDFFYYQRGMSDFVEINPQAMQAPPLKKAQRKIHKVNLDIEKLIDLAQSNGPLELEGDITDNGTVNIFSKQLPKKPVKAKIVFNHNGEEHSLNNSLHDILISVSVKKLKFSATAWQLDDTSGEINEVDVELIDVKESLFKRLGSLNVKDGLANKKVAIIGVGSVGSTAAAQLTKAGVAEIALIDPDKLEVHNIIRHLCDFTDLGRFKTDAVKERLTKINPDIYVNSLNKDFIKEYDSLLDQLKSYDLLVISTDTPDSRNLSNMLSVSLNIPAVYISLHERARSGSVYRIVPKVTGCRHCIGDGQWGNEFIPGTIDYSETADKRDILFQPGLDSDISLVTMLGVKMAISSLLKPDAAICAELNTNYVLWNGYPENNQPMIRLVEGLGIPKNDQCEICSITPDQKEKK